ncbi:ferritin family protein [Paenibacillus pabuli]|uniref:ferritin family protein n=1 Tax=Paenibacillus pabuli TaxID=1472 RepID=UPI000780ED60|nr:ferritin-like domain-containing protein [Paenibacillus pabuli]MEC0128945.1 ferritin-like domain-containing protein [Paenibacillus pabuli]
MYLACPYCFRSPFTPIWAISTIEAIEMMKEAVQGERNDELFYDSLIKLAPNANQAKIIEGIRNDEREHNKMFRQMYTDLTGQQIMESNIEKTEPVESYRMGLQKAFQGELAAVEKYRSIWFGLPHGIYKDTLWGIIIDEQKHADKYNNLLIYNISR